MTPESLIQPATMDFLRNLAMNNNREWFESHKQDYTAAKDDYMQAAERLLSRMQERDPGLEHVVPKECVYRIYRDVRFSADKSPYKTHLGIVLPLGGKKSGLSGYYLHIAPGHSFLGGGVWMPEAHTLKKIRKEIHYFREEWLSLIANPDFKNTYSDIDEEPGGKLTRPPAGYDADNPVIEWIKLKSFTVSASISDKTLCSPDAVTTLIQNWQVAQPLLHFLNRAIQSDEDGGL